MISVAVEPLGQRHLHEDAIDARIAIQRLHQRREISPGWWSPADRARTTRFPPRWRTCACCAHTRWRPDPAPPAPRPAPGDARTCAANSFARTATSARTLAATALPSITIAVTRIYLNTTVLLPLRNTRRSACHLMARFNTTVSSSLPVTVRSSADECVIDALDFLLDDRTLIQIRRHIVRRGADQLHAARERLVIGLRALEARQEGMVNVDGAPFEIAARLGSQNLHVAGEHHAAPNRERSNSSNIRCSCSALRPSMIGR